MADQFRPMPGYTVAGGVAPHDTVGDARGVMTGALVFALTVKL